MTALNNSAINPPVNVNLDIETQVFIDYDFQPGGDNVLIEEGLLVIRDDDGT